MARHGDWDSTTCDSVALITSRDDLHEDACYWRTVKLIPRTLTPWLLRVMRPSSLVLCSNIAENELNHLTASAFFHARPMSDRLKLVLNSAARLRLGPDPRKDALTESWDSVQR